MLKKIIILLLFLPISACSSTTESPDTSNVIILAGDENSPEAKAFKECASLMVEKLNEAGADKTDAETIEAGQSYYDCKREKGY